MTRTLDGLFHFVLIATSHSFHHFAKIQNMTSYGPSPLGPKEIEGLLVPPGKANTLLTDHLITG